MSKENVENIYRKRYDTKQKGFAENSDILDTRFKIKLDTKELISKYRLNNTVIPVLSIPLAYDSSRGVFTLIDTPTLITSRLQAYYYSTSPNDTTPDYYNLRIDTAHRLFVKEDVLENALASIGTDKLRVSIVDALPRSPVTLYDTSNNELSSYLKNLDTALSTFKNLLSPLLKASVFNTSVTANTNILSSSLSPTYSPTTFRIYATFNTAGTLNVVRTKGSTSVTEQLNNGISLNANAVYIFDILVESGETINLQYSANATALVLKIIEIPNVTA
ncbi:MAG: hypothetical protein JHC38_08865 [Thiotrichales bacterium]|jgi:hypothetical protein|nr:hypothetical protein [Thiotrichales bacterium]